MKVKEFLKECVGIEKLTIRCDFNDRDRNDIIDGNIKPSEYFMYNKYGNYGVYKNDVNTEFFIPREYITPWYVGDVIKDIPKDWLDLDIFCVDLQGAGIYIIAMPPLRSKNAIVEDYKKRKLAETSYKEVEAKQIEMLDIL